MKKLVFAMLACYSLTTLANNKAIYGVDSRIDVNDSKNSMHQQLASSVAALIPNYVTSVDRSGRSFSFMDLTLADTTRVCSDERFAHQQAVSTCTGFLVAPDKLITAGHCIRNESDCEDAQWVFDYKLGTEQDAFVESLPQNSVYTCKRVVKSSLGVFIKKDWALIELDRKVVGRSPLKLNTKKPSKSDKIFTIGTPSGLPLKVATGSVRSVKIGNYFRTNLDTFAGNSGSPVFNASNEVIGILVRGDNDYESQVFCNSSVVYAEDGGRGEDVSYIKEAAAALGL